MGLRGLLLKQGPRLSSHGKLLENSPSVLSQIWTPKLSRNRYTDAKRHNRQDDKIFNCPWIHPSIYLSPTAFQRPGQIWVTIAGAVGACLALRCCCNLYLLSRLSAIWRRSLRIWEPQTSWRSTWAMEPKPGWLTSTIHTTWLDARPWRRVKMTRNKKWQCYVKNFPHKGMFLSGCGAFPFLWISRRLNIGF